MTTLPHAEAVALEAKSRPNEALLKSCRILRGVDDGFIESLVSKSTVLRFQKHERVWVRSHSSQHFHQIVSGLLELRRATASHEETLVALFGPGECPGVPVTLEQMPLVASAYASTETLEVLRIPAEPILARLPHDQHLAAAMNKALLYHCRLLHSKIDVLTAGPVPHRMAVFFLNLNERFGDQHEDGSHRVPFGLSRQLIASYVDARVETVIRTVTKWKRENLLLVERDEVVIPNLQALHAITVE